jgi:GR25 family glycosyltransferase involved in LPS biosynthesis
LAATTPAAIPERVDLSRWQADAQSLWDRDQRQDAINLLLLRINGARPELPRLPALQLSYYVFLLGDFAGAEQFMRRLHEAYPHDLEILENLAVMLGRQRKDGEAIATFERLLELGSTNVNCWDGLAAAFSRGGRLEEARQAGERALEIKTAAAQPLPGWQPPVVYPHDYLQRPGVAERCDVIAFSIWGANPRYLRGALRNALLIPALYPGWQARFYLDETVPADFSSLLEGLGAECQLMPAGQSLRQKLCWRFLVANDERVGRFLVRDSDSVVNQREVAAVQAWQASDHWFHVMRDWWTHTDPMLAGMWGGIAGVLPDLQELLLAYQPAARENANVDQWFLRDVLWGSVRAQALIHDRCYRSEGSQPWPTPTPDGNRHVGQDEYTVQRQWQAQQLAAWIQRYPCLQLPATRPAAESVMARWPGPLPLEPPPMPPEVSGWIINLERSPERWQAMAAQIERLGWGATHQRFEACTASQAEAEARGLRSAGQLGLWRSTVAVLEQWLAQDPPATAVLHLIEDDAILHPSLPLLLEPLHQCQPALDLLFTESCLSPSLYDKFRQLEEQRQQQDGGVWLLNGGQYLAGTSSMLLSRRGASRLLQAMREAEGQKSLPVTDMFFRQLIRGGRLVAAVALPFFSTITPDPCSAIQEVCTQRVRLTQTLDLSLRRLLYHQTWQPSAGCDELLQMCGTLIAALSPQEQQALAVELLGLGRSKGWLLNY